MISKSLLACAALALATVAGAAHADAIPYPGGGVNPTTYTFTAAETGHLYAYFLGSAASYDEYLGVLVNGIDSGVTGLDNHTAGIGEQLDFGIVNAGDVLTFYIYVYNLEGYWYSNPAFNSDGSNHVYSTTYTGPDAPAGTYVGFEDLDSLTGSDFNYSDEQFVFTNVATTVPEPGNLALLLAGLGATGLLARRRRG